jgi:hypothetical protein
MTFDQALRQIPPPGCGCHPALLAVANLGAIAGLSESEMLGDIRSNIPAGSRRVSDREITDAVQKAIAECDHHQTSATRRRRMPPKPRKPFDGASYRQNLIERSAGVSEAELWELSPYRITWESGPEDAVHLLDTLYAPDEILFIGGTYDTEVKTVAEWLPEIKTGRTSPYIIPNPVDGEEHINKKGDPSRRCDAAVLHHRFAVVEFDDMTKPAQVSFWHSIIVDALLPVAALIDSGGKSIHAWLRVDLPNVDAWQTEIRDGLYHPETGRMTLLGADTQCQNPSRLSRLAGHLRAGKGKRQRLLYLDPINIKMKGLTL